MKFATNDQKELAKTSLYEVYELAKNNINFQQESHSSNQKKEKYQKYKFIRDLYFLTMKLTILKLKMMRLKDI